MRRNPNIAALSPQYLFSEIRARKERFLRDNPGASLISLSIGDTTEPISESIVQGLLEASKELGTSEGYSGYGPEQGLSSLREKIADVIYSGRVQPEDVFISDGTKCDLGRLQSLFGKDAVIAIQDPVYPVYRDGSLLSGVQRIIPMRCCPENAFFPDVDSLSHVDLIYFCSPNNPTGAVATRTQLQSLVACAKKNRSIIIFDAAYANYIQDDPLTPALPKSIFEIEGADEVAIELGSFSKMAGFTGIRLGWSVVPQRLKYDDGTSIRSDWNRLICTIFNGASNIAQKGGLACLTAKGPLTKLATTYLENAQIIKETLQGIGYEVFGGDHAPYLWARCGDRSSWDMFHYFLETFHVITTPGVGFGPGGEGFVRFSSFGRRSDILQATERLKTRVTTSSLGSVQE